MRRFFLICVVLGIATSAAAAEPAIVSLTASPTPIEIRHQRQPHAIQVYAVTSDGFSLDLHSEARFTSANPQVVTVDESGWVRPVANGETQVTVAVAGKSMVV